MEHQEASVKTRLVVCGGTEAATVAKRGRRVVGIQCSEREDTCEIYIIHYIFSGVRLRADMQRRFQPYSVQYIKRRKASPKRNNSVVLRLVHSLAFPTARNTRTKAMTRWLMRQNFASASYGARYAPSSVPRKGAMQNEDFLVRLGKAEARDRHAEMPIYTPNMTERQKHIYYSRSAREPVWTGQANQPVGGRAQRKWAMKHEPAPWTDREERAYQAAFGRSWSSQRGQEQRRFAREQPTGAAALMC